MGKRTKDRKNKTVSERKRNNRKIKIMFTAAILIILVAGFLEAKNLLRIEGKNIYESRKPLSAESEVTPAKFVGNKSCSGCHLQEYKLWQGSHHDLAMQVANRNTVLGDFEGAKFTYFGLTSEFYKKDGRFMVRTHGPDGKLKDYEIKYTFGVYPLQQYLIEFPGGRLQALSIAWDSRPKKEGGQRWFHLYPDEKITHDDILHWTGPNQNWNYMCAECHSTNLQKNYDLKSDTYNTTWSEINVSCEQCHGPASLHVKWANQRDESEDNSLDYDKGLAVRLYERKGVKWIIDPQTGIPKRSEPRTTNVEVETCAPCHSRRSVIWKDHAFGKPYMDTYLPSLLEEGLYYADGQIQGEVYEYGSFIQSKMYHAGVTCSDCHEPHSLKPRADGNVVCAQCHLSSKYDSTSHHFHKVGSSGASCFGCHMPATTYMIVDPRHDHSIRTPRPDLSVKLGTPNACNNCHSDRTAGWAAQQVDKWYKLKNPGFQNYAENLYAGRTGAPSAGDLLAELAADASKPDIARATAMMDMNRYLSPETINIVNQGLNDRDPMIRSAAVDALEAVEPGGRFQLAFHLLEDPVRGVRIKAARILAPTPRDQLTPEQRATLEKALDEYVAAQMTNAERPEAHLNLGLLYSEMGQYAKADSSYRKALELQPSFVQAYVNLADLYRLQEKDEEGEQLLRKALTIAPADADIYHALGLLLIRQKRLAEAVEALGQSAKLSPDNPYYSYVYAVALNTAGRPDEAIRVLEKTHTNYPNDREVLFALAAFNRDSGSIDVARRYAEKLIELSPNDPTAHSLLDSLRGRK